MPKVCRDNSFVSGGIQNLPRVISLEHIIERVRHPSPASPEVSAADAAADSDSECCGEDDVPCQLCDDGTRLPRRAVKSCLHCNASYCTICLRVCVVVNFSPRNKGAAPFWKFRVSTLCKIISTLTLRLSESRRNEDRNCFINCKPARDTPSKPITTTDSNSSLNNIIF